MKRLVKIGCFQFILAWYDIWVGVYYDVGHRTIYVCPLPIVVLRFQINGKINQSLHRKDRQQ
jgi:hypothetical protein